MYNTVKLIKKPEKSRPVEGSWWTTNDEIYLLICDDANQKARKYMMVHIGTGQGCYGGHWKTYDDAILDFQPLGNKAEIGIKITE